MKKNLFIYQMFLRPFTPEGTLKGAEKMLPHVASLGFNVVYLCPIFDADDDMDRTFWSPRTIKSGIENPKNPYRMKDYFKIDEEYGTDEDLHDFIRTAHSLGILVLLDLVYFHCGPKAVFLAEHPEFASHDENGNVINGRWAFPALNYESNELREYLYSNMEYYVREFDVDGYRCDVAELVPLDFWVEGRRRIKALKPDVFMIDEGEGPHYGEAFDIQYGFKWGKGVRRLFRQEITAAEFVEIARAYYAKKMPETVHMKFFESHDWVNEAMNLRYEKKHNSDLVEAFLLLMYTSDGVPMVYNGNEICDTARHSIWGNRFHAPALRINWSNIVTPAAQRRMRIIRELTAYRSQNPALIDAPVEWLTVGDTDHILAFSRPCGDKTITVIVNTADKVVESTVGLSLDEKAKIAFQKDFVITARGEELRFAADPSGYIVIEH